VRYVPWVGKVFRAVGDAGRGTLGGGVGLQAIGAALGFDGLSDADFKADGGPGKALVTAMYDLDQVDWVDFKNVDHGNALTSEGSLRQDRKDFAPFDRARVVPWLYRLFDRRWLYWDPAMMGRARENVMRHLLPQPIGLGGERRLALVVQRARPIATIATVVRGPATGTCDRRVVSRLPAPVVGRIERGGPATGPR